MSGVFSMKVNLDIETTPLESNSGTTTVSMSHTKLHSNCMGMAVLFELRMALLALHVLAG